MLPNVKVTCPSLPPSLPPLALPPSLLPSLSILTAPRTGSEVYNVKLFPEQPVELLVGEALTLNCTVSVEFNTAVDFNWTYPGKVNNLGHKRIIKTTSSITIMEIVLIIIIMQLLCVSHFSRNVTKTTVKRGNALKHCNTIQKNSLFLC